MKRNPLAPLLALAATLVLPAAAADGWLSDFEAAKKLAADQKKDLLMDFTGSDWCSWCIRLKQEVFDQEVFKQGVADKFILVELDFPHDESKLPAETKAQNEKLATTYAVQGYPTIVLADAKGRPYGQTGYQPGGPEEYLKHLEGFREDRLVRDNAFAEAGKLSGTEKAKAFLNALGDLDDHAIDQFYPEIARDIVAADPDDVSGFQKGRNYRKAVAEYEKAIEALFVIKQFGTAVNTSDAFLAEHKPTGEDKQHILMAKVMAYVEVGKQAEAFAVMEEIREAAPESDLSSQLDDIKVRIEQYIKEKLGAPDESENDAPAPDAPPTRE